MSASLVGSEMCIRDSSRGVAIFGVGRSVAEGLAWGLAWGFSVDAGRRHRCLLYTSDAADDM
eukprot:13121690-Alexandrium_andersonii.AAC.1